MKLTTALIVAAAALYALAARNRRSSSPSTDHTGSGDKTAGRPPAAGPASIDPGMVILRDDHIDDGIAVRPPFAGDPGISRPAPDESDSKQSSA